MTEQRSSKKSTDQGRRRKRRAAPATAWRAASPGTEKPRSSGIALWRQIAEDLELDIATGRLVGGDRLPTETELAARFQVNRHTVRRALGELAKMGLINASPGRGTFVAEAPIAYPIGRSTRFSEVIAGAGREPSGRLLSHDRLSATPDVAQWLQIKEGDDVIQVEHIRAASDVPICVATAWFPASRFDGIGEAFAQLRTITQSLARFNVMDYHRLRTEISSRLANSIEREALQLERGASVLVVNSLNVDPDGVPIQASHTRFAASRVQLIIEEDGPFKQRRS